MIRTAFIVTIASAMSLYSCTEQEETPDIGLNFAPYVLDQSRTYQVDSLVYDEFQDAVDTHVVYRLEQVARLFDSTTNDQHYWIDVSYRTDSTNWNYHHSYRLEKTDSRLVELSNNNSFVRLIFPVQDRVYWDVNMLNGMNTERYRYLEQEKFRASMKDSFPETVFVRQAYDTTIIDKDIRWELYANNVGLVEKRIVDLVTQKDKTGGVEVHWKLIDFKNK